MKDLKSTKLALQFALWRSRGAALVNVGNVRQSEIAEMFPDYQVISVKEVLNQYVGIPSEVRGLLVTGYSSALFAQREQEDRVQRFVRALAETRGTNEGKLEVLVLSDTLPNPDFLHLSTLPWFNGPFQGDDSVWSLRPSSSGCELVQHDRVSHHVRDPKPKHVSSWIDKQTIQF